MNMPSDAPEVLTTRQAAAFMQVDVRTLIKIIERGELPAIRLGRGFRILRSDILALATTAAHDA